MHLPSPFLVHVLPLFLPSCRYHPLRLYPSPPQLAISTLLILSVPSLALVSPDAHPRDPLPSLPAWEVAQVRG